MTAVRGRLREFSALALRNTMKSIKNAENHRKESVPYTVVQVQVQDKYISFLISGSNRGYGKGVDKIQAFSSHLVHRQYSLPSLLSQTLSLLQPFIFIYPFICFHSRGLSTKKEPLLLLGLCLPGERERRSDRLF